uniref:tyrosine-protein phosphatase non-receptor type 18 isoform X4 n=1 Tax=Gasterosteus aculeatus aculeatus TaxID=481459 RepID=UPI001A9987A4|nr:tyrosine-protein phosphatase non-receptor type 18 isoform X4 [Gasterosteus aculeatus aculeatus]
MELLSSLRSVATETLDQEYNMVRSLTSVEKKDLGLTSDVGELKENIKKNRYKDILPYDQSRVVLSLMTSDSDSDYINASFIPGVTSHRRYIASQGPLGSTRTDFWRMIWENDVKVIVMACREIEMGKKCECYWSPVQQEASYGAFRVCNQEETRPDENIVIRVLTVSYQQITRSLTQYQFLSWPDHEVPHEVSGVLDLLEKVRVTQSTHTSPVLIHCSAGCGRTGVLCVLDYIHDLLVTKQMDTDFSIKQLVQDIRRQRPSAVQTKEQYRFIFTAAACMLERALLCSPSEVKTEQKPTKTSSSKRDSPPTAMNDTYAVVNKPKKPLPPPADPAYSTVAPPKFSRTLPLSHHYDNDPAGASVAPVYSVVRPRVKPPLAAPLCDDECHLSPGRRRREGWMLGRGERRIILFSFFSTKGSSRTDNDYEDLSPTAADVIGLPGGMGFNCRIQKPKGPRDPPAEWSRLER